MRNEEAAMLFFAFVFFFAFIIYLEMGLYAYYQNPKSVMNRVFLMVCVIFALWSIDNINYNIIKSKELLMINHRIFAITWCVLYGAILHFTLIFSKQEKLLGKWQTYFALYLPGIIFAFQEIQGQMNVKDFKPASYGWEAVYVFNSFWYLAYEIYYLLYSMLTLSIFFICSIRFQSIRERKQARIMAVSGLFSLVLGYFVDGILPQLQIRFLPPLSPFIILIWIGGIWYATVRYNLMVLTPEIAAKEIISRMKDLLIMVNPEGRIIMVNQQLELILGMNQGDLLMMPVQRLIKNIPTRDGLALLASWEIDSELKTRKGDLIPVDIFSSTIKDYSGEIIGAILVGHDLRQLYQLKNEVSERTRAEQELSVALVDLKLRSQVIENDLNMSRKLQLQFIPSSCPFENIASFYYPSEKVGGDFFDYLIFREPHKIGIFISDVSGHGVTAAFITSMMKSIILQSGHLKEDPSLFLSHLNGLLYNQTGGNFITAFYGIYDRLEKTMIYSSAGHNEPFWVRKGVYEQIKSRRRGIPLAVMSTEAMKDFGKEYSNETAHFQPNDKLLLYTDGIIEAVPNAKPEEDFESAALPAFIRDEYHLESKAFVESLRKRLFEFRGSSSFEDDLCLVCIDIV